MTCSTRRPNGSIPVVGSWVTTSLFGGEFPGHVILPRLYILHVFLLPGLILGLIVAHMGMPEYVDFLDAPPDEQNEIVVGKDGVLRVTLRDETMENLGETVRAKLNTRFLCRSTY